MIFESDDVIQGVRDALGATFVQKASPESLRGKYGIWAGINIAHASDAPETAADEMKLWTTESGLKESSDAEALARAYIQKYISSDADYTMALRSVVKDAIENRDISSTVIDSLKELFAKDAVGIEKEDTDTLATVVFDFVKEEVEKTE